MITTKIKISEAFAGRLDPQQFHPERMDMLHHIQARTKYCKLKDVVKNVKTTTTVFNNDDIYIGLENITSHTGDYLPTNDKTSISSAAVFVRGNILFPKLRPYLNKVYRAEFDGKCSTEFHIFEAVDIDPNYLTIVLRSDIVLAQTKHLMTGNTLPRLQTSDVENLIIPYPDVTIQQKIVAIYQKAQDAKQAKEAEAKALLASVNSEILEQLGVSTPPQNQKHKLIFKAKISSIITARRFDPIYLKHSTDRYGVKFSMKTIGSVVLNMQSGFGAGKGDQTSDNGIIHIRPTNINLNGDVIFDKNVYVPKVESKQTLSVGDVLFNNTNSQELVGKTAVLLDNKELYYSNHITRIKVSIELILPQYLSLILNLYQKERIFYSICTNWNNQSGIGLELLKNIKIPVPPIETQREIAESIATKKVKAKQLQQDGAELLKASKEQIERIILG